MVDLGRSLHRRAADVDRAVGASKSETMTLAHRCRSYRGGEIPARLSGGVSIFQEREIKIKDMAVCERWTTLEQSRYLQHLHKCGHRPSETYLVWLSQV